jgi:hypothetical protein
MISPISSASQFYSIGQANAVSQAASGSDDEQSTGVSAAAQMQALQKQGDFQSFFNNSVAAALLQPADAVNSGTAMSTLVNDMIQQVLGAYKAQTSTLTPAQTQSG